MLKNIRLLLALTTAMALALPAVASATVATYPAGTYAPVGTAVTATGKDITLNSSLLGAITCELLNWNGEVFFNSGGTVQINGMTSYPIQSGCRNGLKSVTVTNIWITGLSANSPFSGTLNFEETVDIASLTCHFSGAFVPFTYTSGTNVIKFSSASTVTAFPSACGTSKLSGEFSLEGQFSSTFLIFD
jgi:hypothetical protein